MTRTFSTSSKPRVWQSSSKDLRRNRSFSRTRKLNRRFCISFDHWGSGQRISPEFRAAHPEVPWKLIAGTRDKLIHFYEGVDLEEVWKMVTSDLPELIRIIEPQRSSTTRSSDRF